MLNFSKELITFHMEQIKSFISNPGYSTISLPSLSEDQKKYLSDIKLDAKEQASFVDKLKNVLDFIEEEAKKRMTEILTKFITSIQPHLTQPITVASLLGEDWEETLDMFKDAESIPVVQRRQIRPMHDAAAAGEVRVCQGELAADADLFAAAYSARALRSGVVVIDSPEEDVIEDAGDACELQETRIDMASVYAHYNSDASDDSSNDNDNDKTHKDNDDKKDDKDKNNGDGGNAGGSSDVKVAPKRSFKDIYANFKDKFSIESFASVMPMEISFLMTVEGLGEGKLQEIRERRRIANEERKRREEEAQRKEEQRMEEEARASKRKAVEAFMDEAFGRPAPAGEGVRTFPPEEVFIMSDAADDPFQRKPYESFIPTMTLRLDRPLKEVDYGRLRALLGEGASVIRAGCAPTVLRIAVEQIGPSAEKKLAELKAKLASQEGRSVVGSIAGEPEVRVPSDEDVKSACLSLSLKSVDLNSSVVGEIRQIVLQRLLSDRGAYDWQFLFSYSDLYKQAHNQINNDLRANRYEMYDASRVIFPSKFMGEYEKIMKKIPKNDVTERFLYVGVKQSELPKILNEHFSDEGSDTGLCGRGVYASENPFYAAVNGSENRRILSVNEKAHMLCCTAVYNKTRYNDLKKAHEPCKIIDDDIKNCYGVNHALVGDSTGFWPTAKEQDRERSTIVADEFVFPNKFQIIPLFSFTVVRTDHYILWKDEDIGSRRNTQILRRMSRCVSVKVYPKKRNDDALKVIQLKTNSPFKLITNGGGKEKTGEKLIENARSLTNSKFVCLVFAFNPEHMEWISRMENVLFTNDDDDLIKFAEMKMEKSEVLKFIASLKRFETRYQFRINENELLNFPGRERNQK